MNLMVEITGTAEGSVDHFTEIEKKTVWWGGEQTGKQRVERRAFLF